MIAVRTCGRLRDQQVSRLLGVRFGVALILLPMVLRQMRVGTFDLDEALAADGLVAAARPVQVWRIV